MLSFISHELYMFHAHVNMINELSETSFIISFGVRDNVRRYM